MGLIYLVRRKKFRVANVIKELYYAVQRKLQVRGGSTERDIARKLAARSGRSEGDILGVLTDLPGAIKEIMLEGGSVTIKGFGTFQTALTSEGCEYPDDVTPGKVRLSKIYFVPDRTFFHDLELKMSYFRYPLSKYFPKELLRPDTLKEEENNNQLK
ncbi:MAG: HU family DNA-binding protein [Bacteroides sp.]|nr:HU family DNA-binding protein [Bacteroides sp.]MCI1681392.1 HU family DNA-binding protein [Bacteroides sp.]